MNHRTLSAVLSIGGLNIEPPIIQGGMGVAVSSSHLAAAVSNEGALGVVAAVGASLSCPNQKLPYSEKSYLGLRKILQDTKKLTSKPFGVNIMCALTDYDELVRAAIDEGAAVIISGAGLPMHLPMLVGEAPVKLVPVVSSVRATSIICREWRKKYRRLPDAIIVEGIAAGGHLGFSLDEIQQKQALEQIVTDVLAYVKDFTAAEGSKIPVIAAGGVFNGKDIARFLSLGAAGVQMGTRFVCTHECDADIAFKKAYVNCTKEDIIIVKSPVGMPLRVMRNSFIDELLESGKKPFACTYHCLKSCSPFNSPYCIAKALTNAASGNLAKGIITCGANAYRVKEIVSVHELITELTQECGAAMAGENLPQ